MVTSAAEAKTAALFYNTPMALELVHILRALRHPQRPIPIKTDNTTAASFVKDTLKRCRSNACAVGPVVAYKKISLLKFLNSIYLFSLYLFLVLHIPLHRCTRCAIGLDWSGGPITHDQEFKY